jgi:hypothetical protein
MINMIKMWLYYMWQYEDKARQNYKRKIEILKIENTKTKTKNTAEIT